MSVRGGERTPLLTDGARPERIAELDTPVATVDLDAVERNIRGMQEYCDRHALRLRPHVKTHKLPELAHMQVEAGAVGITCQKLGEAEVMADAGIADILISFPLIGRTKVERLVCLARRVSVSTVVDSEEGARGLSEGAARADITIPVLVECDTGYRRTGVQSPQSAARLAARVASLPGLRFAGLLTYPTLSGTGAWIARARGLIEAAGLDPGTVSTGGTARARRTHELPHVDELRVGTYVYGDCACIADGSVRPADCALRVRSRW